jgi:hypothetical protein|tara:strand:- start:141 stop:578 length:438 start_codon:yes stop_codon:yes gene_type:complete
MIDLFQKIDFTSHAGLDLTWKIEMDALSQKEWECISTMILELSPPFREAIGIPTGGVKLQNLLNQYGTGERTDPICIVDDVLTTGNSMNEFLQICGCFGSLPNPNTYIGWVVFARNKPPHWCKALFQMPIQNGWKTIGGPGYNYK